MPGNLDEPNHYKGGDPKGMVGWRLELGYCWQGSQALGKRMLADARGRNASWRTWAQGEGQRRSHMASTLYCFYGKCFMPLFIV